MGQNENQQRTENKTNYGPRSSNKNTKAKKKKKRPRDGEWAWVIKQDHKGQMIGPINGRKIGQMG